MLAESLQRASWSNAITRWGAVEGPRLRGKDNSLRLRAPRSTFQALPGWTTGEPLRNQDSSLVKGYARVNRLHPRRRLWKRASLAREFASRRFLWRVTGKEGLEVLADQQLGSLPASKSWKPEVLGYKRSFAFELAELN